MEVRTESIQGTYDELVDAAEDIGDVLAAATSNQIDLTPVVQSWLVGQLERIECALTRELDPHDRARTRVQARLVEDGGVG